MNRVFIIGAVVLAAFAFVHAAEDFPMEGEFATETIPESDLMQQLKNLSEAAPEHLSYHVSRIHKHAMLIQRAKAYGHDFSSSSKAIKAALGSLLNQLNAGHKHDKNALATGFTNAKAAIATAESNGKSKCVEYKNKSCPTKRISEEEKAKMDAAYKKMRDIGKGKMCDEAKHGTWGGMDVDKSNPKFGTIVRDAWDKTRAKYVSAHEKWASAKKVYDNAAKAHTEAMAAFTTAVKIEASNANTQCKNAHKEYNLLKKEVASNVASRKQVYIATLVIGCYVDNLTANAAAKACADKKRRADTSQWNISAAGLASCTEKAVLETRFGPMNWKPSTSTCELQHWNERAHKEKITKEKNTKESNAKELEAKEKSKKEKDAKEVAAKKERATKERDTKEKSEKEKAAKAKLERDTKAAKEKKEKEDERNLKEKTSKEKAAKERDAKAKEKSDKEKVSKEKASKEKAAKEKSAKAKEKSDKEKSAKERASKESKSKESAAKEKNNKEVSAKNTSRSGATRTTLTLVNGWTNWGGTHGAATVSKVDGYCFVQGLIKGGHWGHMATLSSNCRPNKRLIFNMNNHEGTSRIDVMTNGQIWWHGGAKNHGWISLAGMTFSAGSTSQVRLSLNNGNADFGHGYGPPTYVLRGGFCSVEGLVRVAHWGHLATLPSNCRPDKRLIFNLNNHEKTTRVDVTTDGKIHYINGGKAHSWLSMTGIMFPVGSLGEHRLSLVNRWQAYGHGYGSPTYTIKNGICEVNGLIKGGNFGHIATVGNSNCFPRKQLIFNMNHNDATVRIDLHTDGKILWAGGKKGSWLSLSGIQIPARTSITNAKHNGEASSKEQVTKESSNKEKASKESAAKEKSNKEKASKESSAKESSAKERSNKERASKESASKESASKESSSKERANKVRVTKHWWHSSWINGWDGGMNWSVGGHTYFSGLHSTHSNHKEDRLFKPLLTNIGSTQSTTRWSGWINNWDARWDYTCPGNMAVTGMISYHDNGKEDRRWRIRCASFHGIAISHGGWPGWQTNWDATWSIGCGHKPAVGFSSYHDNGKEDRRWRVRCGSIKNRL